MKNSYYPALGKYFENSTELAKAGCMSRTRLWECLKGSKDFTEAEMKAISANIAMRILGAPVVDYFELDNAITAWKGRFDEIYRRQDVSAHI